ncbi:hypothetical protein E4N72_08120 [Treponema vincentii]|uniref:hypothetical protein n=1 Tax=Treponema vincentii TaxID=69710 RepID=UPI0020A2DE16|nr:hypothetical protein [Treponema vincentii]UTC46525.1 hypothetical protein E4N72_08120 [Treponema vincentii]
MQPAAERPALFIPLNRNNALNTAVLFNGNTAADFSENEPVTVRVLSILKNNTIRIAVKGAVLQAQTALSQDIREGAFLLMRVHITDNTVVLTPYQKHILPQIPHNDVFTQLGVPQSDLTAALIAFFRQNEQPLQPRPLLKILSSLHVFAPHEKKAAFAAALLYSRGIEPSEQLIAQCLAAMFTVSDRQNEKAADAPDDADLFKLLNHIKAGKNHWVVFPFEKQLDTLWKGSAAFLLDLQDTVCRECCLRVRSEEKQEAWIFTLKNSLCLFSYQGQAELSGQKKEELTALLQTCLEAAGVTAYTARYADGIEIEQNQTLASIDISV